MMDSGVRNIGNFTKLFNCKVRDVEHEGDEGEEWCGAVMLDGED